MGRNVITKKALTLEQFTGLVKEKYLELGPAESGKDALNYFGVTKHKITSKRNIKVR